MSQEQMAKILLEAKTIAILGAKDRAGTDVDMVGKYLINAGYRVIPVHPTRQNVWGLTTYKSLADIPEHVDIINLFRASEHCLAHAKETLALKAKPLAFWMQSGIENFSARLLLEEKSIAVIENTCIKVVHSQMRVMTAN